MDPTPFVDAYSKTTGRKHSVPAYFVGHPVLGADLAQTPSTRAAVALAQAEAEDVPGSTVKSMQAYAERHDIDLTGLRTKAEISAAIDAWAEAQAETDVVDDEPDPDSTTEQDPEHDPAIPTPDPGNHQED